jgi:hypothetical protein
MSGNNPLRQFAFQRLPLWFGRQAAARCLPISEIGVKGDVVVRV